MKALFRLALISVVVNEVLVYAAPFSCKTVPPEPAYVRAEGMTELLGELSFHCDGDVPAEGIIADVELYANTNIIVPKQSEPLLLAGDGSGGWQAGIDIFTGKFTPPNRLTWERVPLAPPGHRGLRRFRLMNLRMNASRIGPPVGLVLGQIHGFLQIGGVAVKSPQRLIAVLTRPLTVQVSACQGTTPTIHNGAAPLNAGLLYRSKVPGSLHQIVRFVEGFEGAFKPATADSKVRQMFAESAAETVQISGVSAAATVSGTRLQVLFQNVPAGVSIFITTEPTLPGFGTSNSIDAKLISFELNGSGTGPEIGHTARAGCSGPSLGVVAVPLEKGAGSAAWEITAADAAVLEEVSFGVAVTFEVNPKQNLPGLGTAVVSAGYGPLSSLSMQSGDGPVPRFAHVQTFKNFFMIERPLSRLLFPVVSNQAGSDTVLNIHNNSEGWSGPCTLTFSPAEPVTTSTPVRTEPVMQGAAVRVTLSSVVLNYQGCVLAECAFPRAGGDYRVYPMSGGADWLAGRALDAATPSAAELKAAADASYGLALTCAFLPGNAAPRK
jgi:hypothetical protein